MNEYIYLFIFVQAQAVTLTVAQAFKVALDLWEIAQQGHLDVDKMNRNNKNNVFTFRFFFSFSGGVFYL